MISYSRALAVGAILTTAALAGDNFIISQVRPMSYCRVDPLVSPGANGPHVHHVVGGSAFSPYSTSPESLQKSKCSSGMVQDDKSIYWSPLVYYKHANGSLSTIPSSTRIYYFMKPGNGTTPVKAFPQGFRMVAGPPSDMRPAQYPPRGKLSYDQRQAMDPRLAAIMWGCAAGAVQGQGNGGSMDGQRPYLPNDAPNGCGVLNAGIFYPSCSDGRLDSPDHFDHMRYPLDGSNGYNCPSSHPIKYPTMFMEHFYFPTADQPYRGPNQGNWILSSGDDTGLAMHADFINAWTPGVLENVMKQCNTPNAPGDDLSQCEPLAQSVDVDAANKCRSEGDIPNEDVGIVKAIPELPGCNKWPSDQQKKPSCKAGDVPMGQPVGRVENPDFDYALPISEAEGKGSMNKAVANEASTTPSTTTTSTATSSSSTSSASSETPAAKNAAPPSSGDEYNYGAPPSASSPSASPAAQSPTAQNAAQSQSGSQDYTEDPSAPAPVVAVAVPAGHKNPTSNPGNSMQNKPPKNKGKGHGKSKNPKPNNLGNSMQNKPPKPTKNKGKGHGKKNKPHSHRRREWQSRLLN